MNIKALFLVLVATALLAGCNKIAVTPPNIVFILADDLGYSDLGCYGSEIIETPHIDALAEKGLRFTNFYNTGRCWPTRTSLLSGFYPHQVLSDQIEGVNYTQGQFQPVNETWLHEGGISTPLVELAGGDASELNGNGDAPGISLVPFLNEDVQNQRPPLFFHHDKKNALRHGDWKITTIDKGEAWELSFNK